MKYKWHFPNQHQKLSHISKAQQTTFSCSYSGGQNIVDTLYMFYLYALTLGANNFWSVKIVVLYLVCNWRLICFLSISVIEYPISLLLVLWGLFLSASKRTPTQEFISKKSPPNLSSLLADCSGEVWRNDPHEVKNEDIEIFMAEIDRKHFNLQITTSKTFRKSLI